MHIGEFEIDEIHVNLQIKVHKTSVYFAPVSSKQDPVLHSNHCTATQYQYMLNTSLSFFIFALLLFSSLFLSSLQFLSFFTFTFLSWHINFVTACNCHQHSSECRYDPAIDLAKRSLDLNNEYEGGGVCINCQHNTAGINCEQCKQGYYNPTGVPKTSPNACRRKFILQMWY